MKIQFKEEGPDGFIEFSGELGKDEVDWLLRFALLELLQRGMLPFQLVSKDELATHAPINPDMN